VIYKFEFSVSGIRKSFRISGSNVLRIHLINGLIVVVKLSDIYGSKCEDIVSDLAFRYIYI
jgi:hypothetical protein